MMLDISQHMVTNEV